MNLEESLSRLDEKKAKIVLHVSVILSYLIKAVGKILVGFSTKTPILINDGYHGVIDIFEHLIITFVSKKAREESDARFPLGRRPLIDALVIVLGCSMVSLGIYSLIKSGENVLSALSFGDSNSNGNAEILKNIDNGLFVGIVFCVSYLISKVGYKIEFFLSRIFDWKEFRADAIEMAQDSYIELISGVSIVASFLLFKAFPQTMNERGSLFYGVMLLQPALLMGMGVWFIILGWGMIKEGVLEISNPAVEEKVKKAILKEVKNALPEGCFPLESGANQVILWKRGDSILVNGGIIIDGPLMKNSSEIIRSCSESIKNYFKNSKYEGKVKVFLTPIRLEIEQDIEEELRNLVRFIFGPECDKRLEESFLLLRGGDFGECQENLDSIRFEKLSDIERCFYFWVKGQYLLYREGPVSEKTVEFYNEIQEFMFSGVPLTQKYLLKSLVLIKECSSPFEKRHSNLIKRLVEELGDVYDQPEINNEIKAEICFSLGIFWERNKKFDLKKSDYFYRRSLGFYLSSRGSSEADRLYNTWGHFKTLLLEFDIGRRFIEKSYQIKKRRGDCVGIAYSIGGLADNLSKQGLYSEAMKEYKHNIYILNKNKQSFWIPGVIAKMNEALFRWGFLSSNTDKVVQALQDVKKYLREENKGSSKWFFLSKVIVKGVFYLKLKDVILDGNNESRTMFKFFEEASSAFFESESRIPYLSATRDRLAARNKFLLGEKAESEILIMNSIQGFEGVSLEGPIQSDLCRYEMAVYDCFLDNGSSRILKLIESLEKIESYFAERGGYSGNINNLLPGMCHDIKQSTKDPTTFQNIKNSFIFFKPIILLEN